MYLHENFIPVGLFIGLAISSGVALIVYVICCGSSNHRYREERKFEVKCWRWTGSLLDFRPSKEIVAPTEETIELNRSFREDESNIDVGYISDSRPSSINYSTSVIVHKEISSSQHNLIEKSIREKPESIIVNKSGSIGYDDRHWPEDCSGTVEIQPSLINAANCIFQDHLAKIHLDSDGRNENCIRTHSCSTQTTDQAFMMPPTFDHSWQFSKSFLNHESFLQGENSDVRLFIPENTFDKSESVEIFGAVTVNLEMAHRKLKIDERESIATPVVEYFCQRRHFNKSLEIILPHFMPSIDNASDFDVYEIHKSECGEFFKSKLKLVKFGNVQNKSGTFSLDDHEIHIWTKHFTIYLACVRCKDRFLPPTLYGRVLASHSENAMKNRDVRVCCEIWDYRFKIKDFRHAHEKDGLNNIGMRTIQTVKLDQLEPSQDPTGMRVVVRIELFGEEWSHCVRRSGDIIHPEEIMFALEKFSPCRCVNIPQEKEWAITNTRELPQEFLFRCCVDLGYIQIPDNDGGIQDGRGLTGLPFLGEPRQKSVLVKIPIFSPSEDMQERREQSVSSSSSAISLNINNANSVNVYGERDSSMYACGETLPKTIATNDETLSETDTENPGSDEKERSIHAYETEFGAADNRRFTAHLSLIDITDLAPNWSFEQHSPIDIIGSTTYTTESEGYISRSTNGYSD